MASSNGTRTRQSVRRPTQNELILELLADGGWHTTREILAAVPCIVHSRIAEINGRGNHRIEHDGAGGGAENHRYRLVETSCEASVSAAGVSPDASVCGLDGGWADGNAGASAFEQLRLVA